MHVVGGPRGGAGCFGYLAIYEFGEVGGVVGCDAEDEIASGGVRAGTPGEEGGPGGGCGMGGVAG
jgi:hypothetical protein